MLPTGPILHHVVYLKYNKACDKIKKRINREKKVINKNYACVF